MCKNRSPTARVRFFVRERVRLDSCRSVCFHNSSQCRRCTVTRSSYPSCMQNIPLCFPRHTITNAHPTPTTDERCASSAYIYTHGGGIRMSNHMYTLLCADLCRHIFHVKHRGTTTTCDGPIASCSQHLHEIRGLHIWTRP